MAESAGQPGISEQDGPAVETDDEAVDEALRELLTVPQTEEPREPPGVIASWYRGLPGRL